VDTLTLLSWPDYISPVTLRCAEDLLGLYIVIEVVPGAPEMLARMREGTGIDVLCPPEYVVRELAAENRLLPLDHAALPNLAHLMPEFHTGRPHDPQSHVSVIKDWGTTGFIVRTDLVQETPRSWSDFWVLAAMYSGRVTVLDSPGEVIGAALKMRGCSYNAKYPETLDQARCDLLALRPHLLAFETNYRPLLTSGEAVMALGWNGDAAALIAAGVPVRYVIPSEGSQIWEDDWAIAANTAHTEQAHRFLNFVLDPQTALDEALYTAYATGNRAAFDLLPDLLPEANRSDPSVYPAEDVRANLEHGMPLSSAAAALRDRLWREIHQPD
jgi:spermidine/putrescine transport system substrate-binding protein